MPFSTRSTRPSPGRAGVSLSRAPGPIGVFMVRLAGKKGEDHFSGLMISTKLRLGFVCPKGWVPIKFLVRFRIRRVLLIERT